MSVIPSTIRFRDERFTRANGKCSMTRTYFLRTDTPDDSSADIIATPGIPQYLEILDEANSILVKSQELKRVKELADGGTQWELTLAGETGAVVSGSGTSTDPCDQPPNVSAVPVVYSYVAEKAYKISVDSEGTITESEEPEDVANAMGDPYDPPLMTERFTTQFTITYNVRTLHLSGLAEYFNTINEKSVTIGGTTYDAGTLLFRTLQPQSAIDDSGQYYWQVQVILELDTEKHHCHEIGNKGYRYKDANGKTVRAMSDDSSYATVPVWLDADGGKLADDADKIYYRYRIPKKTDWPSVLDLPRDLRLGL